MQWKIGLDRRVPGDYGNEAMAWTQRFFEQYDCSKVQSLCVDRGNSKYEGVYGQCRYPTKQRPYFRIHCHVPGDFPCHIITRKRPLYPRADGSFARAPSGCRRGDHWHDPKTGRQWIQVKGKTQLSTLGEGMVWIVAHEAFHFLRHTRQIPGRNTEIDADAFADRMLEDFCSRACPVGTTWSQLLWPWGRSG